MRDNIPHKACITSQDFRKTCPDVWKRSKTFLNYLLCLKFAAVFDTARLVEIVPQLTAATSSLTGPKPVSRSVLNYPFVYLKASIQLCPHAMPLPLFRQDHCNGYLAYAFLPKNISIK